MMQSSYGASRLNNVGVEIDLSTGYGIATISSALDTSFARMTQSSSYGGPSNYGITTSTTSITFYGSYFGSGNNFIAKGSIKIYGVK
jgi:hypothetical protein